jgi:putative SbcD/Mre11-related phosphoesterase
MSGGFLEGRNHSFGGDMKDKLLGDKTKIRYVGKSLLITEGKTKVLVVGDLHLGYEEMLNRSGVFVSRQMFDEMILDFKAIFVEVGHVDKVILLGDVKHDFGGISRQEWNDVTSILDYFKTVADEIVIVKGNHDSILEPIVKKKEIKLKEHYIWKKFCFMHGHQDIKEAYGKEIEYWVIGHAHPAIKLQEGAKVEKYKCFLSGKYKGKKIIILPSFIDYNVGSDPRDDGVDLAWNINLNGFEVFIVGENLEVLDFGKLKNIE